MTSEEKPKEVAAEGAAGHKAKKGPTSEKLEELRAKVKQLKEGRDALNTKLRSKRDSIMGIYGEIDKLLKDAKTHKDSRDSANKNVSESKKNRDVSNSRIAELNKRLAELKKQGSSSMSRRDYEKIKSEYDKLNWTMQTTPLS